MFSFDFRSAFHHVQMHKAHKKFLGFSLKVGRKKRIYCFKNMRLGYRDASRVITRVFRVPLHSWRKRDLRMFIHIDDGIGAKKTKEEAREAVKMVKKDLKYLEVEYSRI